MRNTRLGASEVVSDLLRRVLWAVVCGVCALALGGCSFVKAIEAMEVEGGVANPNTPLARWATWEPDPRYFEWNSYRGRTLPKHPGRKDSVYLRFLADFHQCRQKAYGVNLTGGATSGGSFGVLMIRRNITDVCMLDEGYRSSGATGYQAAPEYVYLATPVSVSRERGWPMRMRERFTKSGASAVKRDDDWADCNRDVWGSVPKGDCTSGDLACAKVVYGVMTDECMRKRFVRRICGRHCWLEDGSVLAHGCAKKRVRERRKKEGRRGCGRVSVAVCGRTRFPSWCSV
jgi:hypothetical protein